MIMRPLAPGIHSDIPAPIYHADPCPEPSLSGSVAIPLVHRSPRHAWYAHCRLNPDYEATESKRLDLGTAAHSLLLEDGAGLVIVDADSYQTKAAKEARDEAYAAGKTPVLTADYERVDAMAEIARARLDQSFNREWFKNEQTLIWREGEAWCRGRVDALAERTGIVIDYKTTTDASPATLSRRIYDMHYHFKAAVYERGLNALLPGMIGRWRFMFLFQEIEPPYECSMIELSEGGLTIGRKQAAYAVEAWTRCMASGEWPGYPRTAVIAEPPPWIEAQWLAREEVDGPAFVDMPRAEDEPKPYAGWTG
jgi:NAD(P)-dependent dehydrogenase (short-subunit alcohol dehydrogenase family)